MSTELRLDLPLRTDFGVDGTTGLLIAQPGLSVNEVPLRVLRGDRLCPRRSGLRYRLYFYDDEVDPKLIYTYCYSPDGNWASFTPETGMEDWREGETLIQKNGYVRLAFPTEGSDDCLDAFFCLHHTARELPEPSWIAQEARRLSERVCAAQLPEGLRFFLLADTHCCVGGNWDDTLCSLRESAALIQPELLVHLGDLTDGIGSLRQTKHLASRVLDGLRSLGRPVYLCLGNHDENYFRGNPEQMEKRESAAWYLGREKPYYHVDLKAHRLRLYFLDSFDAQQKERYGFSRLEAVWFFFSLCRLPDSWRVLVFSHVPPLPQLHVWSKDIRLGRVMLRCLEHVAAKGKNPVLGWIHGHNHADQVSVFGRIPIISIGCSKLESFPEHKPEGAVTPSRKCGCPEQELWDTVLIPDHEDRLYLFRYGAGEDRCIP